MISPKRNLFCSLNILALTFVGSTAFSQAPAPAPAAPSSAAPAQSASGGKGTKRTNVDFEDQLVQGEVKKPELFYLLQKKQFNFGKLIKLRENFVPEMGKTAEDIEKSK